MRRPAGLVAAATLLAWLWVAAAGAAPTPDRTLRTAAAAFGGTWTDAQIRQYAAIFDLVAVGLSAGRERVLAFRRARPGIVVLAYTSAFDVHDHAPLHGWIARTHPDWFLRDGAGRLVHAYRDPHRFVLDPGRPALRAFFADSARRRVREIGADGVFEDNCFPDWDRKNFARGLRLSRYRDVAAWRAAVEGMLEALARAIAPATLAANQVVPWSRHGRLVVIEDLPLGGRGWDEMRERFAASAAAGRTPVLLHTLRGPDDPTRAFVTASYLLAVRPGAYLGFRWKGPRTGARDLPEYRLGLGAPLGAARRDSAGVWWRDYERARVLVNPHRLSRPIPWPAWARGAPRLGGRAAAIAWRRAADAQPLPGWTVAAGR